MEEETLIKAKLITAVLCRAIDYHAVSAGRYAAPSSISSERIAENLRGLERAVSVAVENLLDAGLE